MSQEIVEALREIEREKGIEEGTLIAALEDGLLAAYKKSPGAARHATVELDERGDYRVYAVELPPDVEERLLDEARELAHADLRQRPRDRLVGGARGSDHANRRHARELRPHCCADGQAGDPAADP